MSTQCGNCRFWSALVSVHRMNGTFALCLSPVRRRVYGPKWTTRSSTCPDWTDGSLGPVDDPDKDPARYKEAAE